jgi:RNA polymerase sigma-B factor
MSNQTYSRVDGLALLKAYSQNASIELRNKIVQLNQGLVRKVAHRISSSCSEPYEDLEQVGYLGLIRAIERFDPSQGCAFSSFAVPYIRGEILHFLRDRTSTVKIPRRWQDLQREGEKVRTQLTRQQGHPPSEQAIAAALGIAMTEWQEVKLSAQNRFPLSLDASFQTQDEGTTLGECLADYREQERQYLEEEQQQLRKAINQLEEKTRSVIEWVFFKDLTRKEVAERIGVSPVTVSRWIHQGVDQLVTLLQGQTLQTDP